MNTLAHLEINSVFAGDFRVVRRLSQGGMGTVYVVEQLSTGKQRALKLMLPQLVSDASLRKRFEQEARVGSRIESEHVVEVVSAGVDAATSTPWLAMELLQGEDLASYVQRSGALSIDEVRSILQQLCHAIAAAHDAGIVHRDLKPENIFLAQARRAEVRTTVKVLDFGIAKLVADARTTATAAVGSPAWMAPEQTSRGAEISPATDVWAIGLITFNLLTGRHFFRAVEDESSTLAALLREVVLDPLPLASARAAELGRSLPQGFDSWFLHAVSREPSARFASVRELHAAFEGLFSASAGVLTRPFETRDNAKALTGDGALTPARTIHSTSAGVETVAGAKRPKRTALYVLGALMVLAGGGLALARPWALSASASGSASGATSGSSFAAASGIASAGASAAHASAVEASAASVDANPPAVASVPTAGEGASVAAAPTASGPVAAAAIAKPVPAQSKRVESAPTEPQPEVALAAKASAGPTPQTGQTPQTLPPSPFVAPPPLPGPLGSNLPDLAQSPFERRKRVRKPLVE